MRDRRVTHSPLMPETVKGEPIRVNGRELVPLVRVAGRVRRRALVASEGVEGGGWGLVSMRPVAIVDRSEAGENPLPIHSGTARAIAWLCVVFLVIPLVASLLIYLSRRSDERHRETKELLA